MSDYPVPSRMKAKRYRFGAHDRIVIGGIDYVPRSSDSFGHVLSRVKTPDLFESFTHEEIDRFFKAEELIRFPNWYLATKAASRNKHGATLLTDLDPVEQQRIHWKRHYCDEFLILEHRKEASRSDRSAKAAIELITQQMILRELQSRTDSGRKTRCDKSASNSRQAGMPSPTQLLRWLRRYVDSGLDPISLRDGRHASGNKTPRKDEESADMAREYARQYASSNKPTKALVYQEYSDAVDKANLNRAAQGLEKREKVGGRGFEKLIGKLSPFFVCAGREGIATALRKFAIVQGGLDVTRPLERVEIDEWKVTLQTILMDAGLWAMLSPKAKAVIRKKRLWLSIAIDCASRCILALRLLEAAPSAESALAVLEMVVFGNPTATLVVGAETPLDMRGIPETVATDSGAGFIAAEFLSAVHSLEAKDFRPKAGLPHLRGTIERFFCTVRTKLIARFPGQTFENVVVKGDYDSEGNACIDVGELERVLFRYVADIYHNTPHEGLAGATPRNTWLKLNGLYGVAPPPSGEIRRHIFGIAQRRRIGNRGIRVLGLYYQSLDLQKLRGTVGQQPVQIRVDRFDLGSISVRVKGTDWMPVPCQFLEIAGTAIWEWIAAATDLRRRNAELSALQKDVVVRAIADVQGTAEMAIARAEIGQPVITWEAFSKAERELFRSFDFAKDGHHDSQDENDEEEIVHDVLPPEGRIPETAPDDEDDEDNWMVEE